MDDRTLVSQRGPLHLRLASRIRVDADDPVSGCWEWTGHTVGGGYGSMTVGNRPQMVHRLVYELMVGPIPDGLVIDHLCRNRLCVNPRHVEPVTNQENVWRGIALTNMGVCRSGRHDVTISGVLRDGERHFRCRECRLESKRRYNQKQAA